MFKNITIYKKAQALLVLVILGLVIISGYTAFSLFQIRDNNHQLREVKDPFHINAMQFKYHVAQIQQWLQDISATRALDGFDDGFDNARDNYELAKQELLVLAKLEPENAAQFKKMSATLENYYQIGQKMAQLYIDEGPAGGNKFMAQFDAAAESMNEKVGWLVDDAARQKQEFYDHQENLSNTAIIISVSLAAMVGVVMVGGVLMLIQSIRPLGSLTEQAERIANSDLSGDALTSKRQDEVGQLTLAIEQMRQSLIDSIQQINHSTTDLQSSSELMQSIAAQTQDGVMRQQSAIDQVATAMNEMTATAEEVARNISSTADAASNADQEVNEGDKVVNETIDSINRLAGNINSAVDVIRNLHTESENIGTVLDVIRGIAEQTNLLALNAAIEAARAGEQGRGFAVVADEVRTLAQRTQESTEEIDQMIQRLQNGAKSAVSVMDESQEYAASSVESAQNAGSSLKTIKGSVTTIHNMSQQIASAATEQTSVVDDINRNIQDIAAIAGESADGANESTQTSQQLMSLSSVLKDLVAKFRL